MAAPMEDAERSGVEELKSSKLGTKRHWDETYDRELKNFSENGDIGEVWFGEDSMERVINWMDQNSMISKEISVMDLGCGNGIMLVELYKRGCTQVCGVDYAQAAVDLAKAIAEQEKLAISYERGDILEKPMTAACLQKTYNLCIDKGTYDAISLCPDDSAGKRAAYISNVHELLTPRGLLLLTSCNWTQDELLRQFIDFAERLLRLREKKKHKVQMWVVRRYTIDDFELFDKIPTPTFSFGGVTGNRETAIVLQKKDAS